jgi:hypothetical protein
MAYWDVWQAFQEKLAISTGHDPFVQHRQYSPIGIISDQTSHALFK